MDVYALIWRSHTHDDEFDQQAFNDRMPALFEWLKQLMVETIEISIQTTCLWWWWI